MGQDDTKQRSQLETNCSSSDDDGTKGSNGMERRGQFGGDLGGDIVKLPVFD